MKVVTAVVNNPQFIEIQYHTLKQYMPCDYEFIVFNDAKDFPDMTNGGDISIKQQIEDMCKKHSILYINIPNEHHQYNKVPSARTADSMNFIKHFQMQFPDEYLLLDSDMCLIAPIDIEKYRQYECAVVLQHRNMHHHDIYYFWNGLYYFDTTKMQDLHILEWDMIQGCDTGGKTCIWYINHLRKNPGETIPDMENLKSHVSKTIYYITHKSSGKWDENDAPDCIKTNKGLLQFLKENPRNENNKFFCELYDNCLLHYRAGGNWMGEGHDFHINLAKNLKDAIV